MDFSKLKAGKNPPEEIYVIIEIPKRHPNKYEIDKESGFLFLDRVFYSTLSPPLDYGTIPSTKAGDGDPLDALVITSFSVYPGVVIPARPIGVLITEDEKGEDEKIIAVPTEKVDPRLKEIKDLEDVPEHLKKEIEYYYAHYKDLEKGKWVKVKRWGNKKEAIEIIKKCLI